LEKQVIIEFLTEHWDTFIAFLAGDTSAGLTDEMTEQCYRFAELLSHAIASYKKKKAFERKAGCEICPGEGLLGKACRLRQHSSAPLNDADSSIITQNGLFVIKQQKDCKQLDTAFQSLVDSVLDRDSGNN